MELEFFAFEGALDEVGEHFVGQFVFRGVEGGDQVDEPEVAAGLAGDAVFGVDLHIHGPFIGAQTGGTGSEFGFRFIAEVCPQRQAQGLSTAAEDAVLFQHQRGHHHPFQIGKSKMFVGWTLAQQPHHFPQHVRDSHARPLARL